MHKIKLLGLVALLSLSTSMVTYAGVLTGNPDPPPSTPSTPATPSQPVPSQPTDVEIVVPEPGEDPGVGEDPGTGNAPAIPIVPTEQEYLYAPKVTELHSMNARLSDFGYSVYFMPTLKDFPIDLVGTVSHCSEKVDGYDEDKDGKIDAEEAETKTIDHNFAIVCPDYFDTEVTYNTEDPLGDEKTQGSLGRYKTSKKVYSSEDNSRLLSLVGYDLLLSEEYIKCKNVKGQIDTSYYATKVGTSTLNAKTIIMDLYKAAGIEEWDITFIFEEDEEWDVNQSHIITHLSVCTSDKDGEGGVDCSEVKTNVFATRTNPELYWVRCKKDAIFDGGAHKITSDKTFIGSECSVGKSFSEKSSMTLSEVCAVARAILTLYGEPVITDSEMDAAYKLYASTIPKGSFTTDAEYNAVMWMAAKGIIDPKGLDFTKHVTFADIEPILLRMADNGSRLTPKDAVTINTPLDKAGYTETHISINPNASVEVYEQSTEDWLDYLLEVNENWSTIMVWPYIDDATSSNSSTKSQNGNEITTESDVGNVNTKDESSLYAGGIQMKLNGNFVDDNYGYTGNSGYEQLIDSDNPNSPDLWGGLSNGNFRYYGIETYTDDYGNSKQYYHFKINNNLINGGGSSESTLEFTFGYKTTSKDGKNIIENVGIVDGRSEFSIESNSHKKEGGVFTYEYDSSNKTWKVVRDTFANADFSSEFKDKETLDANNGVTGKTSKKVKKKKKNVTNEATVVALTVDAYKISPSASYITSNDHGFDFTKLVNNNSFRDTTSKPICIGNEVYVNIIQSAANSQKEFIRFEFSGTKSYLVQETNFFQQVGNDYVNPGSVPGNHVDVTKDEATYKGFYRAEDNSLLVSYNYLRSKGIVSGIAELKDNLGYVITISRTGSNVILYKKDNTGYVMTGDTLYPTGDEEIFEKVNGDILINYRACIGWANNYVIVNSGDDQITVMSYDNDPIGSYSSSYGTNTINLLMPKSSVKIATLTTHDVQGNNYNGDILLSGSYALSPYLIVMDGTNGIDYLFVWHRKGVRVGTDASADGISMSGSKDRSNREQFKNLTGIKLAAQDDYQLAMYKLYRKSSANKSPKGIHYYNITRYTNTQGKVNISFGYVYKLSEVEYKATESPADCTANEGLVKAMKDYANSASDTSQNKSNASDVLALPIVKLGSKLYDVNFNTCTDTSGSPQLPIGTLPYRYVYQCGNSNRNWDNYVRINPNGTYSIVGLQSINGNNNGSVDNALIYTAPVSNFAKLKALGEAKASKVQDGSVYFGTSLAKVSGSKVEISGNETSLKADSKAVCTYKGISNTSIYAVTDSYSGIGDFVEKVDNTLRTAFEDPNQVVDWAAYKFERLVENIDSWSSIVLIFVLNVLPRICMLLFFVLILLSLIKDVKPWRMFNQRVFDFYKALTFGHITVDTVDMKRLIITSCVCLSIFFMIMDGNLFNFIIWICKFFIALYQH